MILRGVDDKTSFLLNQTGSNSNIFSHISELHDYQLSDSPGARFVIVHSQKEKGMNGIDVRHEEEKLTSYHNNHTRY